MRGQIRQRAHIVAMSPRADPPASRTRNDSPRYLYFYCEEIRLGDDTCQTQFGCIRQKNRTVTHSENNTSQMITNCPSFTKSAQEPIITLRRQRMASRAHQCCTTHAANYI